MVAGDWQYREQLSILFVPITPRASFCIRYASSLVHFEEAMNASDSAPWEELTSRNRRATRSSASSHSASRNWLPSRISGLVRRSGLLTKSHANFPLIHVETPLAGPSAGSIFKMCRSLVQTSKLHPTPQY